MIGIFLLTGCASTPTLDFSIPPDKKANFAGCMVPVLNGSEQNKDSAENRQNYLQKWHAIALPAGHPTPLTETFKLLNAYRDKLPLLLSKPKLSVPFDMHTPWFWFFDSQMVSVLEEISNPKNSPLRLLLENKSQKFEATIPGRIAKALKAYLLAYFTISSDLKENVGFISRDGTKFKFPVEIDFDNNKTQAISAVDHSQVGADIIRIIFEAIHDGSMSMCNALPAINKSSTGYRENLLRLNTDDRDNSESECSLKWSKNSEIVNKIQARANAAESMIATAAGKALRGGSMGSLDNEALARAAETAIGVMARHTAERVEWCKESIE